MAQVFASGLDLSRGGPPRHRLRRKRLAAVCLALLLLGLVWHSSYLAAYCLALPGRISVLVGEALLPGYRRRLFACEAENRVLRAKAGAASALAEENDALRSISAERSAAEHSFFAASARYLPCRVAALHLSGFTIVGSGLAANCAVVDARGQLMGITLSSGREATVRDAGQAGLLCRIGGDGAAGALVRRAGRLWVVGLSRGVAVAAGDVAVTLGGNNCPAGLWVGQAATAAVPEEGGITMAVPLSDCAALPCGVCYLVEVS